MSLVLDIAIESDEWQSFEDILPLAESSIHAAIKKSEAEIPPDAEVSILLCDDAFIRDLNQKWRGIDKPTNVLSFPAGDTDSLGPMLGDIVIAYGVARREAEEDLYAAERLATVGEMSAAVAHEIAQPLQVINLACQSALEELAEPASGGVMDTAYVVGKLNRIALQVERSNRIVSDLRTFVRGADNEGQGYFDPAEAVRAAVDVTSHGVRQANVVFLQDISETLATVAGDAGKLEQVLINLINNAKDAAESTVKISAGVLASDDTGMMVRIVVEDDGPGVAPDILRRLFKSFVTTKPQGKGMGLGLRVCRRIVEEMGGSIAASNGPDKGARFEVLLPAATMAAAS